MTTRPARLLALGLASALGGGAVLTVSAGAASAADAPAPAAPRPPLPPGVVARAGGREVALHDFRRVLVDRVRGELADARSGTSTVLQIVLEETVVRLEAERLGIVVTAQDYARRYDEIDRQTREKSRGEQSLADVMKAMGMPPDVFRTRVETMIRKDRIAAHPTWLGATLPKEENARLAQVEVVASELMRNAKVAREGLPKGVVARVGAVDITDERFGEELYRRLAETEVTRYLKEHCITLLLEAEGLAFTPEQVEAALVLERPVYEQMLADAIDPTHRSLSFDDFLLVRYGVPVTELKSSAYRRGLFALRMRLWASATDEDVVRKYQQGADREYGASVVGTVVTVAYVNPKQLTGREARRPRDEALALASDYARRGRGGEPAERLRQEIASLKSQAVRAQRRGLFNTHQNSDAVLFDAAMRLADGAWSDPIETLSEFHVVHREKARAAPTFEQIKPLVRHHWVDERARLWVEDVLRDKVQLAR